MSALPPLVGHEAERAALGRAADRGELPGSLLIHGPPGVGRQRLGLWLGQRLLCAAPGDPEPCGVCAHCRLALRLEHPDLHWFFPLPRPKSAGSPDRLATALEEARAAELEAYRAEPYRVRLPGEAAGIYVAQVQTLRRMALARPAMAQRRVFLIGDAEALVPQEASPEAANALLKVLEEPPSDTTFILTATDPEALLPTIRSRLLPVRLRPLPIETVASFLVEARGVDGATAKNVARLSQGSPGRALGFLPGADGPGPLEQFRLQARRWLEAAASPRAEGRLALAHALPPGGARGAFADVLAFLALWIRDLAACAAGDEDRILNTDARPFLRELVRRLPRAASGAADALRAVEKAMTLGRNNVNPQLTLVWLLNRMRSALAG